MKLLKLWSVVLLILVVAETVAAQAWKQYTSTEDAGWSAEALNEAWQYADSIGSAAFMLIHDGKIVDMHGDVTRSFMCHSVRKSLLTTMYGLAVEDGDIDLDETLAELHIDDEHMLTEEEKSATIRQLLQARSGVYHSAAYETDAMKASRPERGSHKPGTFWYYNNWDFNTACAILMMKTGRDFFEDFEQRIARPLGMEDFRLMDTYYHLEAEHSQFPAYPFRMSARDLARVGQLYLDEGEWLGKQIISSSWVQEATATYSENTRDEGRGYAYMWWTGIYGHEHPNYSMQGVGNQAVIVFPEDDVVMVNRTNTWIRDGVSTEDLKKLVNKIWSARGVLPKSGSFTSRPVLFTQTSAPIQPVSLTSGQLERFIGHFTFQNHEADIAMDDQGLVVETTHAGTFRAFPINAHQLMLEDSWFTISFQEGSDGGFDQEIAAIIENPDDL